MKLFKVSAEFASKYWTFYDTYLVKFTFSIGAVVGVLFETVAAYELHKIYTYIFHSVDCINNYVSIPNKIVSLFISGLSLQIICFIGLYLEYKKDAQNAYLPVEALNWKSDAIKDDLLAVLIGIGVGLGIFMTIIFIVEVLALGLVTSVSI